jgi:hypothetical protein
VSLLSSGCTKIDSAKGAYYPNSIKGARLAFLLIAHDRYRELTMTHCAHTPSLAPTIGPEAASVLALRPIAEGSEARVHTRARYSGARAAVRYSRAHMNVQCGDTRSAAVRLECAAMPRTTSLVPLITAGDTINGVMYRGISYSEAHAAAFQSRVLQKALETAKIPHKVESVSKPR